jgi:hypothetical protein
LRGHSTSYKKLIQEIIDAVANKGFDVVIIDPIYKMLLNDSGQRGFDENSNGDFASFFCELDKLPTSAGVSVVWSDHHAKGAGKSNKDSIDKISGAGCKARYPDAILNLSSLVEPNAYRLEMNLREFPSDVEVNLRWKYPCHWIDPSLDGSSLKHSGGRPSAAVGLQDAWKALSEKHEGKVPIQLIMDRLGMGCERTFRDQIKKLNVAGQNTLNLAIEKGKIIGHFG